jgi:hypothetical protein
MEDVMLRHGLRAAALMLLLCFASSPSSLRAAVVFDNSLSGGPVTSDTEPADWMWGAVVHATSNVTINQIEQQVEINGNNSGHMKFLIFDSKSGDGGYTGSGALLFSKEITLPSTPPTDPPNYTGSGPISFTLEAGKTYDIGVLADTDVYGTYDTHGGAFAVSDSQNGLTSYVHNANFGSPSGGSYANPTTGAYGTADPHIRLSTAVPEPASATATALLAIAITAATRRRP